MMFSRAFDAKGFAVTVLLLSTALAGCGTGENNVEAGNRDGIFHLANAAEPQGLDPHVVTGVPENRILSSLFEGLVVKNPYTLEPEPGVAQRWEVSADGLVYTFYLNPQASWSNGEQVTASDFVWSWNRALHPQTGNRNAYMLYPVLNAEKYVKGEITDFSKVGIEAVDDTTLKVTLEAATPYFLQLMDHYAAFAVHPETLLKFGGMTDRFTAWTRPGNFVGNGAFRLDDWAINRFIKVSKNDTYWDRNKVSLNGIVYHPVDNLSLEERMFRVNQLHRTYEVPLEKVPAYRVMPDTPYNQDPYIGTYYYLFNLDQAPVDDVRVRRALSMAVDRELLTRTVMQNIVTPAYSMVPPGTLGYQPPRLFDFDPEAARALLAEAGYPNGRGWPGLSILYNTHEAHRKIAVAIQQMWKKHLGIEVTLSNQEWKVYTDSVNTRNFQVARRGWIGDYVDPNTFLELFLTGGGNNNTGFADPVYDDLVSQKAPKASTREARFGYFYQAETRLIETMPVIPIYTYNSRYLLHPSVEGMPGNLLDSLNWKYVKLVPGRNLPAAMQ